ncbi:MAG: nucleotide exchange factor GrpE [Arenimonas sp. SCN 70-307]|mgnify:CR=1 FL=1|uniref:nucleotide exchange factor GrpE n=1 Tax=Arenimonas sp. SCN 70-307 TaxID=1660089 RepID=UPI00086E67E6|nr:nucleotide exchange factor GrpE [Arenimonas sp. SCN 70-307]ODS61593.1 MAG: nucleotide exchange factor GrpE [Arenimonas sp. SCN 70-307]
MHSENPTPGAQAPDVPDLDSDLLAHELEQLRSALSEVREEALRERAELDNQRKRLARDVEQARRFANEKLLSQLLPVLDSLEAGLKAAGDATGPLKDGLELTLRQLLKVGEDNGLAQLNPEGQAFDPEWHQAISQLDAAGSAPGTVLQVFQKGYALNDRLLRPALVVVAAG